MIFDLLDLSKCIKSVSDILVTARELKDAKHLVGQLDDLQARLIEARSREIETQEKLSAAMRRIEKLESELRKLEDWNSDSQRYELTTIAHGVFAYHLKPGCCRDEPPHLLCANCFGKRQKSILQLDGDGQIAKAYKCHNCSSELVVSTGWEPPPPAPYDPLNHW